MEENTNNTPAEIVNATVEESALAKLERASIDMQIATAHQYPRSITKFKENSLALVTLDEETAASCLYRRPVGKDRQGRETYAEGMSIRMAEIVAATYGNLRVGTRLIESTPRYVVVQGVAHDLESNFLSTAEDKEPTIDKWGNPYSERMRVVTEKAAAAKARRDAIFAVVPRAAVKFLEVAAKNLLFGNASSISKWRTRIAEWVKTLGIDTARVWKALEVDGPDDLKQSEIEMLIGIKTALQNGDTSLDDAFPILDNNEEGSRYKAPKKLNAKPAEKPETTASEPESAKPETPAENAPEEAKASEPAEATAPSPAEAKDQAKEAKATAAVISEKQANCLFAIANKNSLTKDEIGFLIFDVGGVNHANEIPKDRYEDVIAAIQAAKHGSVLPPEEGDLI